jgi:NADH:ubiquinone oxidoreductase subunit E
VARHLPQHALQQISSEVGAPLGRLYHLATFFKGFSLTPTGEHMVQVCLGTACHVKGAVRVLEACGRELGIEPGQTSEDGKFSLEPVRCVGCCGLAAVMTVDEDLYGHVTSVKVSRLLKKYKSAEKKQEVA